MADGWEDLTPKPSGEWEDLAPKRGPARSSNIAVIKNALVKGAVGVPDMFLNAPNNLLNLGRAGVGAVAGLAGRPDLMPELTQNPDLTRKLAESTGDINPAIQPQGAVQKGLDFAAQGLAGGALTGGAGLARTALGAGIGAVSGLSAGTAETVTGNPAWGAVAGLAPGAAAAVAAGRPNLRPDVRALADEGVQMTPGQIKGGTLQRVEDGATSIPFLGDSIKGAQRRGIESFDAVAINRALRPIGDRLPVGVRGREAVEYARTKLGNAYEDLLPNLRGELDAASSAPGTSLAVPGTNYGVPGVRQAAASAPSLRAELDNIRQMGQSLPEPQQGQLGRIIDREVMDRFTANGGRASGDTLKNIESELGQLSSAFRRSDNYDVRTLGGAVQEIQSALRRMVERVNPDYQGELAKINEGYANFKKIQTAAANIGARDGVFTPAQLQRAVRAGDRTKDKRAFSEGDALMQDLSEPGKNVLSQTVPDSGTPLRAALMYAGRHPLNAAGLGIPLGGASLAYTPWGQRAAQMFLTGESPALAGAAGASPAATAILESRRK